MEPTETKSNKVQASFRVDEDLKRRFESKATLAGTDMTQLFIEFMRRYLDEDPVPVSEQPRHGGRASVGVPTAREIALEFAKMIARPTDDVTILAIRKEVLSVLTSEQEKQTSTKPTKKK